MNKFFKAFDKIEDLLLATFIGVMVIVIFIATLFRFMQITTFAWSEELARYLMIGIVFVGIIKGARLNAHFTVSNFVSMAPPKVQKVLFAIRTLIIIGFAALMSFQTYIYIQNVMKMHQKTPALQLPMWLVYALLLIGFVGMVIRNLQWLLAPNTLHLDTEIDEDLGEV